MEASTIVQSAGAVAGIDTSARRRKRRPLRPSTVSPPRLATAGGEALADERTRDPLGRWRSPATLPESHRGRKAANAGRKFPAEPLTADEVAAVLEALGNGTGGIRDRALFVVLWRGGLRIAEALALYPHEIDLAAGTIAVLHGKGDKRRVVGIDRLGCMHIERWLERRSELGVDDTRRLFCTVTHDALGPGRPLQSSAYRNTLKTAALRAGIRKRVHPHGLRHTHAFELANEGVYVNTIRKQLGHTDLSVTQRYIDHLSPVAVIAAMHEREWPAQLLPSAPIPAALSQSAPPEASARPAIPDSVLAGDPREPQEARRTLEPDRDAHGRFTAAPSKALQAVLDLLYANGGRASLPQIARALGLSPKGGHVHQLIRELSDRELIVSAGLHREKGRRGPGARIWRLAPPKTTFTLDEPHDPRERRTLTARRGHGRQRVLAFVEGVDGRASQAQIGQALGIVPSTVRHHCETLEREGKLVRGGLDKTGSNRGSQVWRLPPPEVARTTVAGWKTMKFPVSR